MLRSLRAVGTTLVGLAAVTLLVALAGAATQAFRLVPVRTGSMTPHASKGSLVVMHEMPVSALQVGTVIAFQAPIPGHPLVMHRVYRLRPSPRGPVVMTKGDANPGPDPWQFRIRGRLVWRAGLVVPHVGMALLVFQTPHARVATLALTVALLTSLGVAAIWSAGALAPICWHAPQPAGGATAWLAPTPTRRSRRRLLPAATPSARRLVPAGVAVLVVGAAAAVGAGAFAVFTGRAAASATYASTALAAPTSLAVTWTPSVKLTWTATTSANATGTRVLRGTTSGGPYNQIALISGLATTSYTDTPGAGTWYYVVEAAYTNNGANWSSANSNQTARQDSKFVFDSTTGFTGSNCLAGTTASKDMLQGYTPAGAESTFTGSGNVGTIVFCSDIFSAGQHLSAGTTTMSAYYSNSAASSCTVTATLLLNGTTSLGSGSLAIPSGATTTLRTWTFSTSAVTFSTNNRLNLKLAYTSATACNSTTLHYNGTSSASKVTTPTMP